MKIISIDILFSEVKLIDTDDINININYIGIIIEKSIANYDVYIKFTKKNQR